MLAHAHRASTGHKSNKSNKLQSPLLPSKNKIHHHFQKRAYPLTLDSQCCIGIKSDLNATFYSQHEFEEKEYEL